MKNKGKILFILSLILNLILAFLIFPKNQIRLKMAGARLFGLETPKETPELPQEIFLSDFKPISALKSEDTRQKKLPSFPVFETHGHLGKFFNTNPEKTSKDLDVYNYSKFINLSFSTGSDFVSMKKDYSSPKIIHFSTFNWKRLKEDNSFSLMLQDLENDIKNGSRGIKLWKNFGLLLRKKNGERLKMNDPELSPLFELCEKKGLIISIHTADPPAFFQQADGKNERFEEVVKHPEAAFSGKEFPKFEEVMKERDELFARHKNLKFISLHFGEYSHNLEKAEKLLLDHPNVFIDTAARIDELGRQPKKARAFFIKWQDRIVFGMDGPPDEGKLEVYSRFLETEDEYFDYYPPHKPRKGLWKIYGIGLPKEVLKKVYYENAEKIFL